jgi:hypothetical protein
MENTKTYLSIRDFIELVPQIVDVNSEGFRPHIHWFLAAIPQGNPQIFRAFSASFAHGIGRQLFRSLCAAISQDLTNSAGEKMSEKEAKLVVLRKSVRR